MIVAIDGPAGSGKSTTAHAIADRCNLTFLDTGAMYRAVTWRCLDAGVDASDGDAVSAVAERAKIEFGKSADGQTVSIDGRDVTRQIRTPEVDRNVSVVSAYPRVRAAMVARQRELGSAGDVVAEGRDIGTVVFPNAEVKVFLTADAAARAHRRAVQREGKDAGRDASAKADAAEEQQILQDLVRRDKLDSSRKESPLKPAEDAHMIDNSALTPEQVVQQIVDLMDAARAKGEAPKAGEVAPFDNGGESFSPKASADKAAPAKAAAKAGGSKDGAGEKGTGGPAAKAAAKPKAAAGRMRAFAGNTFDDYYDHGMKEFPLPARALLAVAATIVWARVGGHEAAVAVEDRGRAAASRRRAWAHDRDESHLDARPRGHHLRALLPRNPREADLEERVQQDELRVVAVLARGGHPREARHGGPEGGAPRAGGAAAR